MESKTVVADYLKSLRTGDYHAYENMTVLWLYSENAVDHQYILLEDALKKGGFSIEEVSEGGSVPDLKAVNDTGADVLILEGEELRGAKQNRTVNTSIIIGKNKTVIIPVSCIERGRWHYRGKSFNSGDSIYYDLRKEKSQSVTENLKTRQKFSSDQGAVWNSIHRKICSLKVDSATENMSDIFKEKEVSINTYQKAFTPKTEQTGFIVFINNKITGGDIFGVKAILPNVYSRLLKGYILDAIEKRSEKFVASGDEVIKKDRVHAVWKERFI